MSQIPKAHAVLALAAVMAMALLMASTGLVAADTAPGGDATFTQNGTNANVSSGGCASNDDGTTTCSQVQISVFVGKMSDNVSGVSHSSQVCLYLDTSTYSDATGEGVDGFTYEAGCAVDRHRETLSTGGKLSRVTLAPATISIQGFICTDKETCEPGPVRDEAIAGTWTGQGQIENSNYGSIGNDGICRYKDSLKGSYREAGFSGTVGGVDLGSDAAAWISKGTMTFTSRCVEV